MATKIAWITDTAAQLDESFIRKHNVHILPLSIVFADVVFKETVDMTQEEFYDKLRVAKNPPKTSQPAIGEMVALYEKLQEQGYDCAIALHVSSGLSGTFDSSQTAAQMVDFKVYPIDSKIGSYPMIKMIEIGNELLEQGHDIKEVVAAIKKMTENSKLSFIPANLNQLHKSGRVSGTQAFLSNLLNIKVVISFEDGKPVMKEKVRANKRAKINVTDLLRSDMENSSIPEIAVIHCNNVMNAESWKEELLQEFPNLKVQVLPLSVCVGVHAGEGTTGLSWVRY
ncbi:DegV family protein [Sporosarcina sp. FSL K6-1540]|uniref:DegV family protein with EDD domain n=1 Tax=Sporosarcina psychrophila TaxID=1476 RepID=A0ABV2KB24_SPOPS|nr:DegV family protein [Sporosarcina psychrophila]AMQ06844.1 fatty acid-binding protein DegV [Sporosarcina psychrophila]